jgi:N-acetylglutamate synthase-like GNAT family acetyltransferase
MGIGGALVSAIVAEAAAAGREHLYLYTSSGQFYRSRGWSRQEVINLHGVEHEIMTCALASIRSSA